MTPAKDPHPGTYPTFEAVQALPAIDLERLLQTGDGPERVWSAWSLGIREGAAAVPALALAADQAPDAGVRATLAVVLAGYGRRDILAVLASDDPDPDVRASACRHLAGTSLPELDWVRELLEDRLRTDSAIEVQMVLLDLAIAGQISIGPDQLAASLGHDEWRIRTRAVVLTDSEWTRNRAMPRGFAALLGDVDLDIRERAHHVALDHLGPAALVRLVGATDLPVDVIVWHLNVLAADGETVPWSAIKPLASDKRDIDYELLTILADGDPGSRPWLLRIAADGDWRATDLAKSKLAPLLTEPPLSRAEVIAAERLRARLSDQLAEDDEPDEWMDEEDLEWRSRWRAATTAFLDRVDRALAAAAM